MDAALNHVFHTLSPLADVSPQNELATSVKAADPGISFPPAQVARATEELGESPSGDRTELPENKEQAATCSPPAPLLPTPTPPPIEAPGGPQDRRGDSSRSFALGADPRGDLGGGLLRGEG